MCRTPRAHKTLKHDKRWAGDKQVTTCSETLLEAIPVLSASAMLLALLGYGGRFVKDKHPLPCGNINCESTNVRSRMRVCSVCLCTYYCSRTCQKAAWKNNVAPHRSVCATLQRTQRSTKVLLRNADPIASAQILQLQQATTRQAARADLPNEALRSSGIFPAVRRELMFSVRRPRKQGSLM